MTDRCNRLVRFHESTDELYDIGIRAQRFGVSNTAWNNERVKIARSHILRDSVDVKRVRLFFVDESLDFTGLHRHECDIRLRFLERLPGSSELYLLDTICR